MMNLQYSAVGSVFARFALAGNLWQSHHHLASHLGICRPSSASRGGEKALLAWATTHELTRPYLPSYGSPLTGPTASFSFARTRLHAYSDHAHRYEFANFLFRSRGLGSWCSSLAIKGALKQDGGREVWSGRRSSLMLRGNGNGGGGLAPAASA